MKTKSKQRFRKLLNPRFGAHFLFWSWNTIFIAFLSFGFIPMLLPEMIISLRGGEIPLVFPVLVTVMAVIPIVAVIIGFKYLRRDPYRLLALGYAIEAPLMLMILIRLFIFRELTPAILFLFWFSVIGIVGFSWMLFDQYKKSRSATMIVTRLILMTFATLIALYTMLWLSFYLFILAEFLGDLLVSLWYSFSYFITHLGDAVKAIWDALKDFSDWILGFDWNEWWQELKTARAAGNLLQFLLMIPFMFTWVLIMSYTATLLVGLPIALLTFYARAWKRSLRQMLEHFGRKPTYALIALCTLIFMSSFYLSNRQPQQKAFNLLTTPPSTLTEAQKLLKKKRILRKGLLNAYLSSRRYLDVQTSGEDSAIASLYENALFQNEPHSRTKSHSEQQEIYRVWNNGFAQRKQKYAALISAVGTAHGLFAQPILYNPAGEHGEIINRWNRTIFTEESRQAADLYQQYFDQPIIEGEREQILRAAKSNWNVIDARTDLRLVDDREVHLDEQTIRVTEHGEWAEVELYEVYSNRTTTEQEVLYYFSLPESAVITGLWLGNSSVKADAFTHRVSPRGAAQQIFQEQVRVRRDPALVEQLGPTQYRLRVYPVAPMQREYNNNGFSSDLIAGARQHMWLSYRVLASDDGWPLPQLSVLRNVHWDGKTQHLLNGENYKADKAEWLPKHVPATTNNVSARWQQVDFDNGQSVLMRAATASDIPTLPTDLKLAVILDRSLSMQSYEHEVAAALEQLQAQGMAVDLYLTASAVRGEAPSVVDLAELDVAEIVYVGGQNSAELLQQFDALQNGQSYAAILVLTDDSGYELGAPIAPVPNPTAPTWMIHLGGYPLGYDDDTLEAIQASGGGSVLSMAAALERIAVAQQHDRIGFDITDGYVWATIPTADVATIGTSEINPGLAPFAARRLILSDMLSQRDHLDALESLDDLHAIAVENSIVTPYSSMIVLVTDAQNRRLDQLENREDRFEREFEEVDITKDTSLSAVPEPHEYLLMALAGLMLLWYLKNQRRVARLRGVSSI